MMAGERKENTTEFAGFQMLIYTLNGVSVSIAGELLVY